MVARLNDLYGHVVPVILAHGGHANKFIGDGLLAVFGAPKRLSDHADRAVAAAIEIAQVVAERFGGELRVGIGVNSGRVVVGTIGPLPLAWGTVVFRLLAQRGLAPGTEGRVNLRSRSFRQ